MAGATIAKVPGHVRQPDQRGPARVKRCWRAQDKTINLAAAMSTHESELKLHTSPTARAIYTAAGMLCVGLGFLGLFLPLLPTTVFILVAAACFSRSSPRFYGWLMNHGTFGPAIRAWRGTPPGRWPAAGSRC